MKCMGLVPMCAIGKTGYVLNMCRSTCIEPKIELWPLWMVEGIRRNFTSYTCRISKVTLYYELTLLPLSFLKTSSKCQFRSDVYSWQVLILSLMSSLYILWKRLLVSACALTINSYIILCSMCAIIVCTLKIWAHKDLVVFRPFHKMLALFWA